MNNNVSAICDALERWEKALHITGLHEVLVCSRQR